MEQLAPVLEYVRDNPSQLLGLGVLVVIVYFALNHRSRMTREAERRINELREERGDYYRNLRPPQ